MRGVIFTHTLRRSWLSAVYWGVGVGVIGMFIMLILPNAESLQRFARLLESMPPALLQAFGASDVAQLATPEGFIGFGYFTYTMLIMSVYGVVAGLNVTTVEEDRGILDILLSAPVSRTQLMVEKGLAYVLLMVLTILVSYLGFVGGKAVSTLDVDLGKLFVASLNMLPAMLTVFGFSVLVGALARSRATALALAVAFVIGSYFIEFIGNAASQTAVAALRVLSYFSYTGSDTVMTSGLAWGNIVLLIAVGAVLFVGGAFLFQRRDIGL